jgi:hypothetical protein
MNKKQIKTLALYSLNYSYKEIGQVLNTSVNTVKWRLKTVRGKYPEYWDNARSIRTSYKRNKANLSSILSFSDVDFGLWRKTNKKADLKKPPVSEGISVAFLLPLIDTIDEKFIKI